MIRVLVPKVISIVTINTGEGQINNKRVYLIRLIINSESALNNQKTNNYI